MTQVPISEPSSGAAPRHRKRLLYYAPGQPEHTLERALSEVLAAKRLTAADATHASVVDPDWLVCTTTAGVHTAISGEYVDLVILDLRAKNRRSSESMSEGFSLLDDLDHPDDVEARYAFHRIVALVADEDPVAVDGWVADLGARGVGTILREHPEMEPRSKYEARVADQLAKLLAPRVEGKTALAASGGGITGIYFELGALKCIDDCINVSVNDFDLFFGISAGAVVSGILAAGYSVDEFMAALAGHPGGRVPELDLQLFKLGHVNFPDMSRRLLAGTDMFWKALYSVIWRRELPRINDLFLDYSTLIGPPFRSDGFERILRDIFDQPGSTNDFRKLRRPLFVGATDQDLRRHVLFGHDSVNHIPISQAIQASLSVHPAFSSVEIEDRYYEDGAVTRTSDFIEAIQRGAKLVFVLDPFVPYVSHQPGAINRQGVLYNIDQDIRALSYTRFSNTRNWVLRQHPEVSTYTFLPSNRVRRLLSANPMDHRPYLAIWRGAYLSTFQRIQRLHHRMRGDLAAHGIKLDLARAQAIAERLEFTHDPAFADFFPDGKVVIQQPPLNAELPKN